MYQSKRLLIENVRSAISAAGEERPPTGRRRDAQGVCPGLRSGGSGTKMLFEFSIRLRRCGRLRQLKVVYDPTNRFRINANIAPAEVESVRAQRL